MRSGLSLALACLVLLALAPRATAQPARRGMTPAETLAVAEVSDAQLSPDGEWVVYVLTTNDGDDRHSSLWLARAPGGVVTDAGDLGAGPVRPTPLPLSGVADPVRPRWSPDGRRLAFLGRRERDAGIWLVSPFERGPARLVAVVRETNFHIPYAGESLAWSPDGRRLAYISATEEETEAPRASERRDDPRLISRLQYKSRTSFSDRLRTHLFVLDLEEAGAQPRQLTSGAYYDHALTWSARGDEIAFVSNREPDPEAVNNSDIFIVSVSDARTRRVTDTRGCEYDPQWSPDGRFIAYTATTRDLTTIDSVSEDAHVWLVDPNGGGARELSRALDRRARLPRWSPDSTTVFFLANDRGQTNIYASSVDGTRTSELFGAAARMGERCRNLVPPPPPSQVTGFSVGARAPGLFALTLTDPMHPAEVFLWKPLACVGSLARLSGHNDALLRTLALSVPEEFTFRSFDGTQVEGWLMRPTTFRAAGSQRVPVILTIHGGPHGMYGYNFDATFQAYAARGYAVLFINPRGSNGYGQKFSDGTYREWGGGDYRDLMAGVDEALARFSYLDGERMAVTGASYGGFMTNWVITQTPRFRAAVARASVSNLISFYATSLYQDLIHAEFGLPWDDYDLLWRWSPLRYVRDARTPTLFIHGEQDNDVHITQAEEMYTALRRRGIETLFARYPREGHSFHEPAHRRDALERTLAWFDRFLKQ